MIFNKVVARMDGTHGDSTIRRRPDKTVLVISPVLRRVIALQGAVPSDAHERLPEAVHAGGGALVDGGQVLEGDAAVVGVGDGDAVEGVLAVGAVVVPVGVEDAAARQLQGEGVVDVEVVRVGAVHLAEVLPRLAAVGGLGRAQDVVGPVLRRVAGHEPAVVVQRRHADVHPRRVDHHGVARLHDLARQTSHEGGRGPGRQAEERRGGDKEYGSHLGKVMGLIGWVGWAIQIQNKGFFEERGKGGRRSELIFGHDAADPGDSLYIQLPT